MYIIGIKLPREWPIGYSALKKIQESNTDVVQLILFYLNEDITNPKN